MDPIINTVPDLHDWIFKYLTGNDVLEITEVSPNWNAVIANSKAMRTVTLNIKLPARSARLAAERKFREVERKMENITRRYQNMSLDFNNSGDPPYALTHKLLEFLTTSAPMLFELKVMNMQINTNEERRDIQELVDKMDLSKLRALKLHHVSPEATSLFLNRCNSVTKLELKGDQSSWYRADQPRASIPGLRPFLVRNESLEEMDLYGEVVHTVVLEEATHETVRLKLKRLKLSYGKLSDYIRHNMTESNERNFLQLLESQSQSLEWLYAPSCRSNVIKHIFNRLPALTSLSASPFLEDETHLNVNEKIVELTILESHPIALEATFQLLPNLTMLFLANFTEDILRIVAGNLPHLRRLRIIGNAIKNDDPIWAELLPHATVRYDGSQRHGWIVTL